MTKNAIFCRKGLLLSGYFIRKQGRSSVAEKQIRCVLPPSFVRNPNRHAIKLGVGSPWRVDVFSMLPEDQIKSHLVKLDQARQAYERDHPEWHLECLFWILERGLGGLRKLLSSGKMSWKDPFVELRFPVDCQWATSPDGAPFVVSSGNIREEDLKDDESIVNTLTKIMVSQIEIETLQNLTHNAVYVREGEGYRTMFSSDDVVRLEAISSLEERDQQVRALLRPCSFGGGTIDEPPGMEGDSIPDSTAIQLAEINPPLLMVPTPAGTETGKVAVIFEIGPMVADVIEKIAYFPLIVGLTLFAEENEEKADITPAPGWLKFADWSEEERDNLWKTLFATIADNLAQLGPAIAKEVKAAVLTINAQIEVKQRENESLDDLRLRALAELQKTGTVVKFDSEVGAAAEEFSKAEAIAALARVEAARSSKEKGETLEQLMELLFGTIKGFRVSNRLRTETEEIDLVIVNSNEVPEFRAEGPMILVECKNWSGNCGKNEFIQLQDKMRNRGERCTLGFLVSWKGFAETITKEMLRSSREKLLIIPLAGADIKDALQADTFHDLLIKAWEKALLV